MPSGAGASIVPIGGPASAAISWTDLISAAYEAKEAAKPLNAASFAQLGLRFGFLVRDPLGGFSDVLVGGSGSKGEGLPIKLAGPGESDESDDPDLVPKLGNETSENSQASTETDAATNSSEGDISSQPEEGGDGHRRVLLFDIDDEAAAGPPPAPVLESIDALLLTSWRWCGSTC